MTGTGFPFFTPTKRVLARDRGPAFPPLVFTTWRVLCARHRLGVCLFRAYREEACR